MDICGFDGGNVRGVVLRLKCRFQATGRFQYLGSQRRTSHFLHSGNFY